EPVTVEEWIESLAERQGEKPTKGAERAITWFRENGFRVEPTKSQDALAAQLVRADGKPAWPFFIRRSSGGLDTALGSLINVPPFDTDDARKKLLEQIRSLPTKKVKSTDSLKGWPSIAPEEILKEDVWADFQSLAVDVKTAIEAGTETQGA